MSAPVIEPAEKGESQLATRFAVQVKDRDVLEWTTVFGIESFTASVPKSMTDNSDADSDGWGSDFITQRKQTLALKLKSKLYDGEMDPGQKILLDASEADEIVPIDIRWFERNGGPVAKQSLVYVDYNDDGGNVTSEATATVNLSGQGKPEAIANPMGVGAVATISTALPASQGVGEWVELIGTGFNSITSITVGGVAVVDIAPISSTVVHIKLPAGSAGSAPIIVTKAAGPSVAKAYTRI